MKNQKLIRRLTSGLTAFAAAATCVTTGLFAPQNAAVIANAADDTDNYAKLLQYSMYLYDGNMCGGEVVITSEVGKGTVAKFIIPKEQTIKE